MFEDEECSGEKCTEWDSDSNSDSEGFLDDDMDFLPAAWGKNDKSNEDEERAEIARKAKLKKEKNIQASATIKSLKMKTTVDSPERVHVSICEPEQTRVDSQNLATPKNTTSLVVTVASDPAAVQISQSLLRTTSPETSRIDDSNTVSIEETTHQKHDLEAARAENVSLRAEIAAMKNVHKQEMERRLEELESRRKKEVRLLQNALQVANTEAERSRVKLKKAQDSNTKLKQKFDSEVIKNDNLHIVIEDLQSESSETKGVLESERKDRLDLLGEMLISINSLEKEQNDLKSGTCYQPEHDSLLQENIDLKNDRDAKEPLVKIGADIRLRFLDAAREHALSIPKVILDRQLRLNGNIAAHRGNAAADAALFKGNFIPDDNFYNTLLAFRELYGHSPSQFPFYDETSRKRVDCQASLLTIKMSSLSETMCDVWHTVFNQLRGLTEESGGRETSESMNLITQLQDLTDEIVDIERSRARRR